MRGHLYTFTKRFFIEVHFSPRKALDTLEKNKEWPSYYCVYAFLFVRVTVSEFLLNHCITRGSALAFALLITLIPLLASSAYMLSSVIDVSPAAVSQMLGLFLPFAPPALLATLTDFFVNAQKLRGLGIAMLIVMAVGLFGTVEESLNTLWKVVRARAFFVRLRTFTMVMVYSPILFLASFQFRRYLTDQELGPLLKLLDLLPFLLSVLAFTSLVWFVPNTKVSFKPALLGGLCAGLLFELERHLFSTYVELTIQTQTIYGAYGLLPLFLVSLWVVSLCVLIGAEVAYVGQNFHALLRAKSRWDRRIGDQSTYISVRMLVDVVAAFIKRQQPPTLAYFIKIYELTDSQALGMLRSLVRAGFLHTLNDNNGYVPTQDLSNTPLREVLGAIEDQHRKIPAFPDDLTRSHLADMLGKMSLSPVPHIEGITLAMFIEKLDTVAEPIVNP
jgi:membrane protein